MAGKKEKAQNKRRKSAVGSIMGSLVAAHIIGFMETITTTLITPQLRGVFTLFLIIIILVILPKGLFGREEI